LNWPPLAAKVAPFLAARNTLQKMRMPVPLGEISV
jgi:hypothetical protein